VVKKYDLKGVVGFWKKEGVWEFYSHKEFTEEEGELIASSF